MVWGQEDPYLPFTLADTQKQAFPGAPSKGLWMQLEGPLRNPYFGAEMIDCGTEIK